MKDNELGKALLKQEGLDSPAIREAALEELRRRMAVAKVRARRMKRLAIIAWVWTAAGLAIYLPWVLAVHLAGPEWSTRLLEIPGILKWLFLLADTALLTLPIAIAFTISYLIRWRSASLLEINVRLMHLEEQISRLTGAPGMDR